jgi:hypothetical protein
MLIALSHEKNYSHIVPTLDSVVLQAFMVILLPVSYDLEFVGYPRLSLLAALRYASALLFPIKTNLSVAR